MPRKKYYKIETSYLVLFFRNPARKIALLFYFLSIQTLLYAQECIPNGGFEEMYNCPLEPGEIRLTKNWYGNEYTPDYFNKCFNKDSLDVLNNYMGYRHAFSGNGHIGLVLLQFNKTFYNKANYLVNEVVYARLNKKLDTGSEYCLQFAISLADSSKIHSDSIFVMLSENPPRFKNHKLIEPNYTHGIKLSNQTNKWLIVNTKIFAEKDFSYIYLGLPRSNISFKNYMQIISAVKNKNTTMYESYYFIDNISLVKAKN